MTDNPEAEAWKRLNFEKDNLINIQRQIIKDRNEEIKRLKG